MCRKEKSTREFFKCGTNPEKIKTPEDRFQRESAQKGCADRDPCDLNTDL